MRVSMNWLRELLPSQALDSMPIRDLAYTLDMTGTAVEGYSVVGQGLAGVVVGQIIEKVKHPEADRLWVTKVEVGAEEPLQIVCGAMNFEAGDKVPVALVGAELPGGFKIKKAKMRGVESHGMNCSARELEIGGDAEGLMILPADAPVGLAFADYLGSADTILELEITPNRPDCLSMVGVAREFGAVLQAEPIPVQATALAEDASDPVDRYATVEIADPSLCYRYTARVIRGVKVGPSPQWLSDRLTHAGIRSISNVVDVTNYIMLLHGQPLHAFDLNTIGQGPDGRAAVTIRPAADGERITTLDDVERVLNPKNQVIADPTGPITLAGVMGAAPTEISDATVDVFLEAAVFDPANTSRTSRSLALISESSMRFERGVDRTATPAALDAAAAMIAELAGGTVCAGRIDAYPTPYQPVSLTLTRDALTGLIGEAIPLAEAAAILGRLGFGVAGAGAADASGDAAAADAVDTLTVTVPAFRPDVTRQVDLIEEVLRIYGMERITPTLPGSRARIGGLTRHQKLRNRVGAALRACGLNEAVTYPFGDPGDMDALGYEFPEGEFAVQLHNPMSSEQAHLRRMLLPSLLRAVSTNQRHGVANVHLYEDGTTFVTGAGRKLPKERETICAVAVGAWGDATWNDKPEQLDFFDAKGILENVARELKVERLTVRASERPWLQPGRSADIMVRGDAIGWVGELHPAVAERFDVTGPVVAFEFDLDRFVKASSDSRGFTVPPRFPSIDLDIAMLVDADVTAQDIERKILQLGKKAPLESVRLFDVYTGKGIEPGKKSMAYTLSYRLPDRTLTSAEVEAAHAPLVEKLLAHFGATMRG